MAWSKPEHAGSRTPLVDVGTHNGSFHADEVVAFTVLQTALKALGGLAVLRRTRDRDHLAECKILLDVGAEYDPDRERYDHHQNNPPLRPDGETPYSTAGLIWEHYGRIYLRAALVDMAHRDRANRPFATLEDADIETIWRDLDQQVFLVLDRVDNGRLVPDATSFASQVDRMNPSWRSDPFPEEFDDAFKKAVSFAQTFLEQAIARAAEPILARDFVLGAHATNKSFKNGIFPPADPRILILDRKGVPWMDVVHQEGLPVLYAVAPTADGSWSITCMPPEPGSFAQKLPLPEAWAGLRDAELAAVTGVKDAVFCHRNRFCGGARSYEGVIAMVDRALELGTGLKLGAYVEEAGADLEAEEEDAPAP